MGKLNKKEKLGKTLSKQIEKMKRSIDNLENYLEILKSGNVWNGTNTSSIIKDLKKQVEINRDLLSQLEKIYSDNYSDDILLNIKF